MAIIYFKKNAAKAITKSHKMFKSGRWLIDLVEFGGYVDVQYVYTHVLICVGAVTISML